MTQDSFPLPGSSFLLSDLSSFLPFKSNLGAVIVNKVKESPVGEGFDAYNETFVNKIEAGILDPVKVTRSALQNANSVASTLLTTESVVATIKEPAPAAPAAPDMGGMY